MRRSLKLQKIIKTRFFNVVEGQQYWYPLKAGQCCLVA